MTNGRTTTITHARTDGRCPFLRCLSQLKITEYNTSGTESHLKFLMKVSTFQPNMNTFQTLTLRSNCTYCTDIEDFFLLFEDKCSQTHTCAGRIMGIQSHVRDKVLKPPGYDPRDIVALVERYGDAHISGSGWRPVDPEEWIAD